MFNQAQQDRFWSKVAIGAPDDCWPWLGAAYTDRKRTRGRFYANGKNITASQAATIIVHGPMPLGAEHLHSCDNPLCCNPLHLRWGSHAENMAEMKERERGTLKQVCSRGHPMSGDNLRILKRGNRECRACQDIRKSKYLKRKRQNG